MEPPDPLRDALPAAMPALQRFVRSIGVPAGDRDDVVQEALARAWRSRRGYDPERPLVPWLCKTALRTWLDLRTHSATRTTPLVDDVVDPRADPSAVRDDLGRALGRLSGVERETLVRFHRDGETLAEIAARTGMPVNTVKSHLHRARQKLGEGPR